MAKLESSLTNMVLALLLISMVMAAALGFVYNLTKGPIAEAEKAKEVKALKEVLPAFDNDPVSNNVVADGLIIYTATKQGNTVGYAVKTFSDKGYSGNIDLMVGFLPDYSVNRIVVLQQKETPGLGTNMLKPKFSDQFLNLNIANISGQKLMVKKDGGTIDAISAATITSRAYCDGVQKAYETLIKNLPPNQIVQK